MRYSVNAGSISSVVKIVNFVGRAGSEYGLSMAVTRNCRRKLRSNRPAIKPLMRFVNEQKFFCYLCPTYFIGDLKENIIEVYI